MRHATKWILVAAGGAIAAVTAAWFAGYRLNTTESFPLGIWRIRAGEVGRGDLVFFHADPRNPVVEWGRGADVLPWNFGRPPLMLKRIVALPGDVVTLTDRVAVNGQTVPHSRIFAADPHGRAIPSVARSGVVAAGMCWLMSDQADRSFDSRYFGAVARVAIVGRAEPVWLWQP